MFCAQDKHLDLLKIFLLFFFFVVFLYMFGWNSWNTQVLVGQIKISHVVKSRENEADPEWVGGKRLASFKPANNTWESAVTCVGSDTLVFRLISLQFKQSVGFSQIRGCCVRFKDKRLYFGKYCEGCVWCQCCITLKLLAWSIFFQIISDATVGVSGTNVQKYLISY